MKNARRQSRELALQALYAWQISGGDPVVEARGLEGFDKEAHAFAESLVRGVRDRVEELQGHYRAAPRPRFRPALAGGALDPLHRHLELLAHPETPFKVVVNEAIELGKSFGGARATAS